MEPTNNPVVICEDDYNKLADLLNLKNGNTNAEKNTLAYEIARAIVVKNDAFPVNTIRLNSKVIVTDTQTGKDVSFTVVMPEDANAKDMKISILTPMAAAIIGFREGDEVSWKMPAGTKHLKVKNVSQPVEG